MCGICGAASTDRERPIDAGLLRAMTARLSHRGPDGEGIVRGAGVGLGHRRLAIIDLSAAAAQPLSNEDGTVLAVVNGEIYNHRELRQGLEATGHRFRSRTDSEVVVHLYEERGEGAIGLLEGMFAFAIWDSRTETLLLARDPLGEKPLYYHEAPQRLLFASEIGALLEDPEVSSGPDDLAIHHYLSFRFVPSPFTGLRGIRKLPPGHILRWQRGRSSLERYYEVPRQLEARSRLDDDPSTIASSAAREEMVRVAVGKAVAARLESDVPLGVLLSGGLDSAVVAYEAAKQSRTRLKTFTVSFEESDYDESGAARRMAAKIGAEHHEITVRPDMATELPEMIGRLGEPFGDSSVVAVWLLAREVRRHVTVALGGDGGDELFGGYDRYRALRLFTGIRRMGSAGLVPLAAKLSALAPFRRGRRNLAGRFDRFARASSMAPREANCAWLACFADAEKSSLYAADFGGRMEGVDSMNLLRQFYDSEPDYLDDVFHADLSLLLPDDLLLKLDVASMASSLEVRSPFLDRALVDLAVALPARFKVRGTRGKRILRDAYRGVLPAATLRGRKAGFGLPVDRWLRGPLRDMSHDLLLDGRFTSRGYFDGRFVTNLLREHQTGLVNNDDRIWSLLCLELWFRNLLEARA